jgi:hypothetical protein
MKRPRVRFTVRTMMVLVAVAGLTSGVVVWHGRMRRLSALYEMRAAIYITNHISWNHTREMRERKRPKSAREKWRDEMAEKYTRAARYPWLPVEPDPPPP